MKRSAIFAAVMLAVSGLASAGSFEQLAGEAGPKALEGITVPAPVIETRTAVMATFKDAVKKAYEANSVGAGIDALPVAKESELPKVALNKLKKYDHQYGPDYMTRAYKMMVQGKMTYVIQNDNDGGMLVDIFAADGATIAGGLCSESGDFRWDDGSGWGGTKALKAAVIR